MAFRPARYQAQARANGVDQTVQMRELTNRELVRLVQWLLAV